MNKEAINKTYTSKLLKNVKCIANNNSYLNYFYMVILQAIFMWDIPVCGECKTGTINRQSHTK